jgi:PAS domain S-box-containing protein
MTEQKMTDMALLESEKKFRGIMERLNEVICLVDLDGNIQYVSPGTIQLTGRTAEEIEGGGFHKLLPDKDLERVMEGFAKLTIGEDVPLMELDLLKVDGSLVRVEIDATPILKNGDVVGVQGIVRDVTERKEAEKAVRRSEETLRSFMESATDSFSLFDAELNLIDNNKVAMEMFFPGIAKEEIIGKNLEEISPGMKDSGVWEEYMEVIRTGTPLVKENYVPHPKFGERILTVKAFKMGDGMGMITTDMTEQKRAELVLRQRARDEVYGFLASAFPVFAANVPQRARDILVKNFGERFENNMRPKLMQEMEASLGMAEGSGIDLDDPAVAFNVYLKWIADYFLNFGTKVEYGTDDTVGYLALSSCPWATEGEKNPIFCLICRTMVYRSFTWTNIKGNVTQTRSIAGGAKSCKFDFRVYTNGTNRSRLL